MPRALDFRLILFRKAGIIVVAGLLLLFLSFFVKHAWADQPNVAPDAPGSIAGSVMNDANTPLMGIEVTIFQQTTNNPWQLLRTVQTDARGTYKITLLSAGIYRLRFRDPHDDLAQLYYPNAATVETATDIVVAGVNLTNINMVLASGGRITGAVTTTLASLAAAPGNGYSNYFVVRAMQMVGAKWVDVRTVTPLLGATSYTINGLPAGMYRVCTTNSNFYGQIYPGSYYDPYQECYADVYAADDATDVKVEAGATTANIDFVLGDGADLAQIGGTVTGAQGEPLAKIRVLAQPQLNSGGEWAQVTDTNSSGVYQLPNLKPGAYTISFFDTSGAHISELYNKAMTADVAQLVTIKNREKHTDLNASLTVASHITGRLTVEGDSPPNGYMTAYRKTDQGWQPGYGSTFYAQVDSSTGHYDIGGLTAGVYKINGYGAVEGPGYPSYYGFYGGSTFEQATPITLTVAATRTEVNFNLTGPPLFTSELSGVVTAKGTPLPGIKVSLYDGDCCPGLPPIAGTPIPLPTVTPMPASSTGALASHVDIPETKLAVRDTKPRVYVYTDANGHYTIGGLTDSMYFVGFSDPAGGYATTYYENQPALQIAERFWLQGTQVLLSNGAVASSVNASLVRGGGISGNVHLKNGTPVANVAVSVLLALPQYGLQPLSSEEQTDAAGNFTLKGLPAGVYYLCFSDQSGKYQTECYGAPLPSYSPEMGIPIIVQPDQVTSGINLILGPKETTYLPLVQQNAPPTAYFNVVTVSHCERQAAGNWFEGTISIHGQPKDGYKVVYSFLPEGPWLTAPAISGPHADYPGWRTGYYSQIIQAHTPVAGEWYVWVVDDSGRRTSEIAHWTSTGPGKGCNQAVVDFDSR
ncbi:MAG: carboxypeptidase-like regulatory domain-containing protein [Chloroflexi bacterium]|nr:carboxypeptidase-like regulatory domain-containing protein [Chloroflexota bacterium]